MLHTGWFARVMGLCLAATICNCCGTAPTAPDAVADAGPETITCADGLVLWEEYNVCAPRVDDCPNPWELPLIGGGCMAIGPRACPKGWDPDSDVDCEPGELMEYDGSACPEGFVLTEDEVACIPFFEENCGEMEIPVLGGGCKKVGPDWGEEGEPYFDYCPDGHLALPGGGCVQVGPRACPKLWDPDADVDCEVGDVLPCEEGWVESEDGLYCEPVYDDCPFGERPLLGGGCERVIPLAGDCPPGPFPEVPEGATNVVYVLAESTCVENCGSELAPFPSIQAAVDVAPDGGYVLVGKGAYDEGLSVSKALHVAGLCAAKVTLHGQAVVVSEKKSDVETAVIAVADADGVHIRGLGVAGLVPGVAFVGATDFSLEASEIAGCSGAGIYIAGKSQGVLDQVWVHDVSAGGSGGMSGFGIVVKTASEVLLSRSIVESAHAAGVMSVNSSTVLNAEESVVRTTEQKSSGLEGYGVRAGSSAKAFLKEVVLESNSTAALKCESGAGVEVEASVLRHTKSGKKEGYGRGVSAGGKSDVSLNECLVEGNSGVGVAVEGSGTTAAVVRTVIRATACNSDGYSGMGIQAGMGCLLDVVGSLVEDNQDAGLAAFHVGTEVAVSGSVVRRTVPDVHGQVGTGILSAAGCTTRVDRSVVEGNSLVGVAAQDTGTVLKLESSVVRGTTGTAAGAGGRGAVAGGGSQLAVTGCLLDANAAVGVAAMGPGTQLMFIESAVRNTGPDEFGQGGRGVQVSGGGQAIVADSLIDANREFGIMVLDSSSQLGVEGVLVRGTAANLDGSAGFGVGVSGAAVLSMDASLVIANDGCGISVVDDGSSAEISRTAVVGGMPPIVPGQRGGVQAAKGSSLTLEWVLVHRAFGLGLLIDHPGTSVVLDRSVVSGTESFEGGGHGYGIQAVGGSGLVVAGCLLQDNVKSGLVVAELDTHAEVVGAIVRDTRLTVDGERGVGVDVFGGAGTLVELCLIEDNSTAGLTAVGIDTEVSLSSSAILNTAGGGIKLLVGGVGEFQVFGDGVFIGAGNVEIADCVISGNERTGMYFYNGSGSLSGTVIAGNLSHGLALEDSVSEVSFDSGANFIFGNASSLSVGTTGDVTTDPKGLPPPPSPEVAEFPDWSDR